jgi:DNA polymerase alpha subunit A
MTASQATGARNFAVKEEEKKDLLVADTSAANTSNTRHGEPGRLPSTRGATPVITKDGTFELYWIDAREQSHFAAVDPGSVMLFGRTKTVEGQWRSCCVRVRNLMRCVLCLPKPGADEMAAVQEITALCRDRGINERRVKPVDRWYAFEEEDTPRDKSQWLKLRYPARFAPLHDPTADAPKLKHIQRLFGVNRSLIELFLVKRQFKGPSHVSVKHAAVVPDHEKLSHCDIEITVEDPKNVTPVQTSQSHPAPTLTAASIQVHAQLDPVKNVNEIFGITISFIPVSPDTSTRSLEGCEHVTAFRPPTGTVVPFDFPRVVEKAGLRNVRTFGNEAALLNWAMAQLKQRDPDMLVGHNFLAFTLDVLLHRLAANRVQDWSVLGRLRLRTMPKLQTGAGGTRDSTYQEREVCVGRLVVDTYLLAREHHRATNYKLIALSRELQCTGLYANDVSGNVEEQPDLQSKEAFTAERLLEAVSNSANLSLLAISLCNKLDLVPLTRGLCALAGNLWARVLTGSRSERIEYLLLHAFHHQKFVTPDRRAPGVAAPVKGAHNADVAPGGARGTLKRDRAGNAVSGVGALIDVDDDGGGDMPDAQDDVQNAAMGDEADAAAAVATKRKAKYQGGMVLEPKTGLYKEYILLLDFNSLYPSIIQEFDICFTTIQRRSGETPSIPTADALICPSCKANPADMPPQSSTCKHRCILPKVIFGLVASRRQVKRLMQTERDPNMLSQLEIRQKALKLTANSMYGCLGFEFSRFYAQELAELVTEKGREALAKACEIVDGTQLEDGTRLDVIYGDTDSVMIRTQQKDLRRVREIAERIQKDVNKRYTKLEIGIDGVFCAMLLHKKKKYAALTVEDFMGEGVHIKREVKGLDMVRRDWCPLTKMACSSVLNALLDLNIAAEDAVEIVIKTMADMANAIRGGVTYELPLFTVSKSLTRDPEVYKDTNQPHVQVALRMKARNEQVRSGDLIPYVVCTQPFGGSAEGESTATVAAHQSRLATRAYHVDEVKKNPALTLDTDWYLATQILPPVARLCEHVEGFTMAQLAEAMGIKAQVAQALMNEQQAAAGATARGTTGTSEGYSSSAFRGVSLEDAFPLASVFWATCRHCRKQTRIQPHEKIAAMVEGDTGLPAAMPQTTGDGSSQLDRSGSRRPAGPKHRFRVFLFTCSNCPATIDLQYLTTQLRIVLHRQQAAFYAAGGDDAALETVRQQLLYLRALFDIPLHINGTEWEAHQNVLRMWAERAKVYRALADRSKLSAASWEDCSNPLKETVTEVYESLYGSVVDPAQLFRGMLY